MRGVLSERGSAAAALVQTLLLFSLTTLPTPLYGDYARLFHFSILTLTLVYATYVAGTLGTLFVLGRLSDQTGRRPVALAAIAGAAFAALLFATARNTAMLFAARLVTGVAAGLSSGTMVAWLRELYSEKEQKTGALKTVAINVLGLGVGPLLSGVLADWGTAPLLLTYLVYGALLAPLAIAILLARETVAKTRSLRHVKLGVRLEMPRGLGAKFAGPGLTTFVLYSLVGFYSALVPSLLSQTLHLTGHIWAGGLMFEFFLVATVTVYAASALSGRTVMLLGAGLMLPALALLALAELQASLPWLVAAMAAGGIALGTGYRGALQEGTRIAPGDKRAQFISLLFICGNLGMAIPVIGVGVAASLGNPEFARLAFAGVIAAMSLGALAFGLTNAD